MIAALSGELFARAGEPPCAFWTRADAVFSGKVLKIENASKSEDLPAGARKVRFQVLQNFKGADNPTFSLVTADAKTGGLEIKKGETWIIYANNDIVVKSFMAFRGVKIEPKAASEELETLKSVVGGKTQAAISGRIVSDVSNGNYEYEPVEITVENKGKRMTAQTDSGGAFNIPAARLGIDAPAFAAPKSCSSERRMRDQSGIGLSPRTRFCAPIRKAMRHCSKSVR